MVTVMCFGQRVQAWDKTSDVAAYVLRQVLGAPPGAHLHAQNCPALLGAELTLPDSWGCFKWMELED